MTRAELARELRHLSDSGMLRGDEFLTETCIPFPELMAEAAAALEKEDRDARRYYAIRTLFQGNEELFERETGWHRIVPMPEHIAPRRILEIRSQYRAEPIGPGDWHYGLDAALDAWLEECGQEDRA